jgi:DNA-directed RNA polymerase subunit omega
MAEPRSTMIDPPIEELLEAADSKFTLVTVSARRARQINAYYNQLGEGLGTLVPPQVASTARKPLSIAFEEIAAGKVRAIFVDPGAELEDGGDEADRADGSHLAAPSESSTALAAEPSEVPEDDAS